MVLGSSTASAQTLPTFGGTWKSQGPGPVKFGRVEGIPPDYPVTGPVQVIVPHPTNADILWIGAVNGGIWKTTNALSASPTWVPVGDQLPSLSIGAMALDPTDATHNTLVAGFGRFSTYKKKGGPRAGVVRSTNGGTIWNVLPAPELQGKNITAIVARGNMLVVAVNEADAAGCANVGIFRSVNTGATFTRISGATGSGLPGGLAFDLADDPSNNAVLYTVIRDAATCTSGGVNGVYRSADTGATWTKDNPASVDPLLADASFTGAALDVDPSGSLAVAILNNRLLAGTFVRTVVTGPALMTGPSGQLPAINYQELDLPETDGFGLMVGQSEEQEFLGGLSLSFIFAKLFIGGNRQPGPGDGATTFPNALGATNYDGRLFRCDPAQPSGSQCTSLTHCSTATPACNNQVSTSPKGAPHVNSRALTVDANGRLLQGDDGGIYVRTNPTGTGAWLSLNGNLVVSEMISVAYDSLKNEISASGNTICTAESSFSDGSWHQVEQFDCGEVAVDDTSSATRSRRFSASGEDAGLPPALDYLHRRDFEEIGGVAEDWYVLPLATTDYLVHVETCGTPQFETDIYLYIMTEDEIYQSADNGVTFRSIATGHYSDGTDFDCTGDGSLWVTSEQGANAGGPNVYSCGAGCIGPLTQTAATPGTHALKDVVVDPANSQTVCVINDNDQVFCSDDAGASWTDVTGNLGDEAVGLECLEFIPGDQDAILIGAQNGVYRMEVLERGLWQEVGYELPDVFVWDLEYDEKDDILVAATLGRGIWSIEALDGSVLQISDATVSEGDTASVTFTRSPGSMHSATVQWATRAGTAVDETSEAFVNTTLITIPTSGNAVPYPSPITVAGMNGTVTRVTATFTGLSHDYSSDVDAMMVSPNEQSVMLMSDAGSGTKPLNVNLTFDDRATQNLLTTQNLSGTYRPTNYDSTSDAFTSPAPSSPYGSALSVFNGTAPNGEWKLFIRDDTGGLAGSLQSWGVNLTTNGGDFPPQSGSFTFAPGVNTHTLNLQTNEDTVPEGNETFFVRVVGVSGVGLIDTEAMVTIIDDDGSLLPPTNVVATASGTTSVDLTWTAAAGAASYRVYRTEDRITYSMAGTATGTSFTDSGVTANKAYLYKVRSFSGTESGDSNTDHATTVTITDANPIAQTTTVKAVTLIDFLAALNALQVLAGITPTGFPGGPPAVGLPIRAQPVAFLRSKVNEARQVFATEFNFGADVAPGIVITVGDVTSLVNAVK